jgi:hypothetical protein
MAVSEIEKLLQRYVGDWQAVFLLISEIKQ